MNAKISLSQYRRGWPLALSISTLIFVLLFSQHLTEPAYAQTTISFGSSGLQGITLQNPTSLQFGPDGRLYVSQQNGTLYAYTVTRNGPNNYTATTIETIDVIKLNTPNHNDNGDHNATQLRQITGLLVTGTGANPVVYVSSSDWRISVGQDSGLDTNSGIISRLTCVGGLSNQVCQQWEQVDIVRGLPRSEENHSVNGMTLDAQSNSLYIMVGGNTNKGAPSGNFAGTQEYYLAAALLKVDLNAIDAMPVYTDPRHGSKFVYDLRTLDDPTRANINNTDPQFPYVAGHPLFASTIDPGDPFGGNDGLNQAIPEPGGPVQIYSPGFRNAYDVVLTEGGRLYGQDNGPNSGWGGTPLIYNSQGNLKGFDPALFNQGNGDYCTNQLNESGASSIGDKLHYISSAGYYAGHPAPIRAFPTRAGMYIYENIGGVWQQVGQTYQFADLLPADLSINNFPDRPTECVYSVASSGLATVNSSTNGITEYTATNFNSALRGNLLTASFNGNINRYVLNQAGTGVVQSQVLFSGFGSTPLDVSAQGDDDIFGGTIWAVTYGADNLTVFEPADYDGNDVGVCSGANNDTIDEDGDGYTNADELHSRNNTTPCSAGSKPRDFDQANEYQANGKLFKRSDAVDTDDDNDTILDLNDSFQIDPQNGLALSLPVYYPFWNDDPGTGLFGLGFTGLATNGVDDYLTLFDETKIAAGGAAGLMTIEAVTDGTMQAAANSQQNAFQFGINVDSNSPPFVIHSQLRPPYFEVNGSAATPVNFQSFGIYLGKGDQDNYIKMVFNAQGGNGGMSIAQEVGGVFTGAEYNTSITGDILNSSQVDLFFVVNPATLQVESKLSLDQGATIVTLGGPIQIPSAWLQANDGAGLAIGIVSTSHDSNTAFGATWDFINVVATAPADLSAAPTLLDFGVLAVDETKTEVIRLQNVGDPLASDVNIEAVNIVGGNAAAFSHDFSSAGTLVSPGAEFAIAITFDPQSEGIKNTNLEITYDGGKSLVVPLAGEGHDMPLPLVCVNSGSNQTYSAADGTVFQNDQFATGGNSFTLNSSGVDILNTEDDPIYKTERYGNFSYSIPVSGAGQYVVQLHFAEIFYGVGSNSGGLGSRIFNVAIEGVQVLSNYDIFAEAGGAATAVVETFDPVNVADSTVNIQFSTVKNNAKVSAICVLAYGAAPVNSPPVIEAIDDLTVIEGGNATLDFSVTDPDGELVTIDVSSTPDSASFTNVDIQPVASGNYDVSIALAPPLGSSNAYNFTVTADDGDVVRSELFALTVTPQGASVPSAEILVTPTAGLSASTYTNGSIRIMNTGQVDITMVKLDLSSAILPDVVFDPVGLAGDTTAKCVEANTGASTTGYIAPSNPCTVPFSQPHNGVDGNEGYDVVTLNFNNFNPTETFAFSVDIDPTVIKGDTTSGESGSVSGLELSGARVTIGYANGVTLESSLFEMGNLGGGRAVVAPSAPTAPQIAVDGVPNPPATVNNAAQTVRVTGPANRTVRLLQLDARLHIDAGGGGYDIDPFEANEALVRVVYTVQLNQSGQGSIPVTLLRTLSGSGQPLGGLNHFMAAVEGSGNQTSLTSNAIVLEYTPNSSGNTAPVAAAGSDQTVTAGAGGTAQVQLNGAGSSDSDGTIVSYIWTRLGNQIATGATATVALPVGVHEVTLTVTDDDGATDTDTVQLTVNAQSTSSGTVLYRVNVGGPALPSGDSSTVGWGKDNGQGVGSANASPYFVAGDTSLYNDGSSSAYKGPVVMSHASLPAGVPAALFVTERWDPASGAKMQWAFPVAAGTTVEVRLYLAEIYGGITAAGQRVFHVGVEGQVPSAFTNIDPFAVAGAKGALMLAHQVTVQDGTLDLDFRHVLNNPALKGIEIVAVGNGGGNAVPVAAAGSDQTVTAGAGGTAQVQLNGAGSSDSDGTIVSYVWTRLGNQIATGATATVALPVGVHEVTLTVTDDDGATDTDTVQLTVNAAASNAPPVAAAGSDQTVTAGTGGTAQVQLNGAGSSDSDGTIASYVWTRLGNQIATGATATVALPVGVHEVTLTVTDDDGATDTDTVQLTVNAQSTSSGTVLYRVNVGGPALPSGDSSTVGWSKDNGQGVGSANASPYFVAGDTSLYNDGSSSAYKGPVVMSHASLPAGVPAALFVTERWDPASGAKMQWAFPVAAGTTVEVRLYLAEIYGGITAAGQRVFHVGVEGQVPSAFTNIDPFAVAGAKGALMLAHQVTVQDGTLDLDFRHVLNNPALKGIEIVAVGNGGGNAVPVAAAGSDQTVTAGAGGTAQVQLNGAGSSDSDGTIVSYVWTRLGNQIATGATATVALPVGVHEVTLTVTDDDGATDTDTVQLTVNAAASNVVPVAAAGSDQTVTAGAGGTAQVQLNGSGSSDSDGTIVSYIWTRLGNQIATGATATVALPVGVHEVTLTVTDDDNATDTDTVQLTVNAQSTSSGTVLYRVNVGGPALPSGDSSTVGWSKDNGQGVGSANASPYFVAGNTNFYNDGSSSAYKGPVVMSHASLPAGVPAALFVTERWDPASGAKMQWAFPVAAGTTVEVRLYFAEIYGGITAAGQRVFHVGVEGQVPSAFTNIDPFAVAGAKGALMLAHQVTVQDGTLGLDFRHVLNNPTLKGIEIVAVGNTVNSVEGDVDVAEMNAPPVAAAGADQVATAAPDGIAEVQLDGSGSDSDNTIVHHMWTRQENDLATGASATVTLTVGVHEVTLIVFNEDGATATDTVQITVNPPATGEEAPIRLLLPQIMVKPQTSGAELEMPTAPSEETTSEETTINLFLPEVGR